MRDWIIVTLIAAAAVALNLIMFDFADVLFVLAMWVFISVGMWALGRAGTNARQAMREESRLHNRERPIGVTVDFDGAAESVPCEVIADPEGEVDQNGNPLSWIARPLCIPEGSERIVSYHVGIWPPRHGISLTIEGLDQ